MRKIMNTVYLGIIMNNKEWYIIDAKQAVLGRLASKIATLLKGKHKPTYLPHEDNGDYVVVVNAKNLNVTGNKLEDKEFTTIIALVLRELDKLQHAKNKRSLVNASAA